MEPDDSIRVMLVDDHAIMRDGLADVLEHEGGFEVVGQAGDGVEAVSMVADANPDIVILDLIMPRMNGIDACREIISLLPTTRVMVLTASTEEDAVIQCVAAGATGYLQKYSGKEKLVATLRDVMEGEFRIPGEVMQRVISGLRGSPHQGEQSSGSPLTQRERDILALFSRGRSYAQIAEAKGNRPLTIRNAIYAIQAKLGTRTKQELVVWAVRNGLLDDLDV